VGCSYLVIIDVLAFVLLVMILKFVLSLCDCSYVSFFLRNVYKRRWQICIQN
jgi:hypothetical protein